jgi:nitrate reductase cytochrome c-type subunit
MSTRHRYPTRNKTRIDQTISELLIQLPSTRRMASSNIEHAVINTNDLQFFDNKGVMNSETSTATNSKASNESILSSFHPLQQPPMIPQSAQTYSLQTDVDYLRKELELLKLNQSQQQINNVYSYPSDQ